MGRWTEIPPRGHVAVPRDVSVVTSIEVLLALAGHTMHRTAPTTENHLAEVDKPCLQYPWIEGRQ